MKNRWLLFAFVALLLAMLAACSQPAEPTPEPTPTETDDSAETTPDQLWATIEERGSIMVGVSADYPPFEYYTDEFTLDGFDIALMNAIADELGIDVEYQDIVFDGLGGALQLGQIDVAISAISRTPERDAVIDFSNTYFVSSDAILALESSDFDEITEVEQLAPLTVGVQAGSVYENWLQDTLVDTELMPSQNLFVYRDLSNAERDLQSGRIDAFVLDLLPAETAVAAFEDLAIIGQDLNSQRLAIALPEDETTLQTQLNTALAELQADGTVNSLVVEYIGLTPDNILPIPPVDPEEPETGGPEPACIDGMAFVEDLNYDDNNMTSPPQMQPGQTFQKGWRLRNVGTCTWDSSYTFVYAGGNVPAARMDGRPVPIVGTVAPGQTYDVYVNLVAPLTPGVYQGFWSMRNPAGILFGSRVWVGVEVVGSPTPTPLPTQTPSPDINFSANPTTINAGQCSTLTWQVENVSAVYLYAQGQPWQNYPVAGSGTRTVCPTQTTVYELRVIKTDGSVEIRQIRIEVIPTTQAPTINFFNANPASIQAGHCLDLSWQVSGQVDRVDISSNGNVIWGSAPLSGRLNNCPTTTGTIEYSLNATGPGGSSRQVTHATVTSVVNTPTPTPVATSTPAPQPPIIFSFSVIPNQIVVNECVNISWNTGGGTTYVRIVRDGQTLIDGAPLAGAEQNCLSAPGNYIYGVEVRNAAGNVDFQEQRVTVSEAVPDNPLAGTNWTLTGASSPGTIFVLIPGTSISASFSADWRISGSGGCNTYSASYTIDGSAISITIPSATNVSCETPEGVMQQEAFYLAALPTMTTYQISGSQLTLKDSSGQTTLTFTSQ